MAETTMTADQREAVQATIDAGEKVWMVHPEGFTMGVKFETDAMQQVEARIDLGYTLTTPTRQG